MWWNKNTLKKQLEGECQKAIYGGVKTVTTLNQPIVSKKKIEYEVVFKIRFKNSEKEIKEINAIGLISLDEDYEPNNLNLARLVYNDLTNRKFNMVWINECNLIEHESNTLHVYEEVYNITIINFDKRGINND